MTSCERATNEYVYIRGFHKKQASYIADVSCRHHFKVPSLFGNCISGQHCSDKSTSNHSHCSEGALIPIEKNLYPGKCLKFPALLIPYHWLSCIFTIGFLRQLKEDNGQSCWIGKNVHTFWYKQY